MTRSAEPPRAEPPAARQFAAWLEAFNSLDRARLAAYHEQGFAPDARNVPSVDDELGFAQQVGGFIVKKTEESTPTRFVAIVKERASEQHARAELEVDAAPPHRVRKLALNAIATPEDLRPPRLSEADALAALRTEVERAVAADEFSGAVLIARRGVPIFAEAYGFADRDARIRNTLDTRFRIGSMNKMFTATATLQLIQAGKLATTTPLAAVLPSYPNKALAAKVTIHHLLNHTGGTGDIFGPDFDAHRLDLRTHRDYLDLYGKRDLEFEPGERWAYSNYGFVLLGAVIEKLSGKTYYDHLHAKVFRPAGMTSTASPPEPGPGHKLQRGRSVAYTRRDRTSPWTSAADTLPYRGTAAGGGDSTVNDLLRFASALTAHKLLDARHTALLTTGVTPTPGGSKYAYGFSDDGGAGVRCFGHGGGAQGMNGELTICDSGYTIAILANLDPPAASNLATFIANRLPARAP